MYINEIMNNSQIVNVMLVINLFVKNMNPVLYAGPADSDN